MGSESLHEPAETLNADTVDTHRGVASLLEELDAIDWYNQRVDATGDSELVGILEHNRDEEKEHAAMLLEWLRRRDPKLDAVLRRYLFTERPILEIEDLHPDRRDEATNAASGGSPSLAIGGLQDKELL